MSASKVSKSNSLLSFLGSLGAILIFALILLIAYLPNRPAPVDAQVVADRQVKADEARAAGIKKLTNLEVVNAETGTARIPIENAKLLTIASYQSEPLVSDVAEVIEAALAPPIEAAVAEDTPSPALEAAEATAHGAE